MNATQNVPRLGDLVGPAGSALAEQAMTLVSGICAHRVSRIMQTNPGLDASDVEPDDLVNRSLMALSRRLAREIGGRISPVAPTYAHIPCDSPDCEKIIRSFVNRTTLNLASRAKKAKNRLDRGVGGSDKGWEVVDRRAGPAESAQQADRVRVWVAMIRSRCTRKQQVVLDAFLQADGNAAEAARLLNRDPSYFSHVFRRIRNKFPPGSCGGPYDRG
ncbi:MAG TPA: hypothetical protein VD866_22320 [Urbifossiella sp.]|nr:hypothetical protein [Urbifossiella sp.]